MPKVYIEHEVFRVARAAVELVCSPGWEARTDAERALERVLREAGWVVGNPVTIPLRETASNPHSPAFNADHERDPFTDETPL